MFDLTEIVCYIKILAHEMTRNGKENIDFDKEVRGINNESS